MGGLSPHLSAVTGVILSHRQAYEILSCLKKTRPHLYMIDPVEVGIAESSRYKTCLRHFQGIVGACTPGRFFEL